MSLCTFIMIASSVMRMIIYIRYYYLTFLRIFVLWMLAVLFVMFIGVLINIYRESFPLFRYGVIAFCAVSYHGIRSLASSGEDQLKFKYYTQVTVAYGETLWDLSDDYIDYDEYKNKKEYIAEVQSINHLAEEDSIRAGQTLIVPYCSYDFVK